MNAACNPTINSKHTTLFSQRGGVNFKPIDVTVIRSRHPFVIWFTAQVVDLCPMVRVANEYDTPFTRLHTKLPFYVHFNRFSCGALVLQKFASLICRPWIKTTKYVRMPKGTLIHIPKIWVLDYAPRRRTTKTSIPSNNVIMKPVWMAA